MQVIVTGGGGLIGRALTAALAARGDEVRVTSRDPSAVRGLPRGVEAARWDAASADELAPLLAGADAVVHLAGAGIAERRWSEARKRAIRDSRTRSTAALAAAFARAASPPRILLQGSAVGYYGSRGDEELAETAAAGTGFLADVCVAWEAAGSAVEDLGVRRAVLRTGVVLATEGGALPKMALPFRFFAGGPVGSGRQWVPWIHMADEVGAILFLLDSPQASGVFNLTAPEPATNRALARAIGRALRRPSFLPAPAAAMKLALGEMAELLLASQKALPAALLAAGYPFRFATAGAALEDLLG
ncbi:MAG: TIGR01777 family oxidoreductase [Acidobacteriota bacterium]|nr:TIGR01777 family oxidoreductase [Acidobacteriota bacterium]MDH3523515.1 TIGR01777 family oxidoreductase [Acidobacteriota bacterium]